MASKAQSAEKLVRALQGRREGVGWIARCPAHDDRHPSLEIRESDGRILMRCHAGCEQRDVIAALPGRWLWPEREKRPRWTYIEKRNWRQERDARLDGTYWSLAAELLAEWALAELPEVDPERHRLTKLWQTIRLGETSMVAEYREWKQRFPEMTSGMVRAGQDHHTRTTVRLMHWVRKRFNV